eukprot:gene14554-biopygen11658
MVERFHRQLKSSLKAHPDSSKWSEALPLVLLSIRNTIKADLDCTPSQLVFGTTLRLPGEFFTPSRNQSDLDPANYAHRLQLVMQKLSAIPLRQQSPSSHIPTDLASCTHVFVRHDAVRKPLQAPYDGPYKVLHRTDKHFSLDIKGKPNTVSIDRLKVAHLDTAYLPLTSPPPLLSENAPLTTASTEPQPPPQQLPAQPSLQRTTRSGRHVHFPVRYGFDS